MTITNQQLKSIAAAVLIQAAKDYKDDPNAREPIERWIKDGSLFIDVALPDYTEDDIIKALRDSVNSNQEKYHAKNHNK